MSRFIDIGVARVNSVLTDNERQQLIDVIMSSKLNDESGDVHYGKSFGNLIDADFLYPKMQALVSEVTQLQLRKVCAYGRIYSNNSVLKPHIDRDGLDIVLSIQLENTFDIESEFYAIGLDGVAYPTKLNDGDGKIIYSTKCQHWRNEIVSENKPDGYLVAVFFHFEVIEQNKQIQFPYQFRDLEHFIFDAEVDSLISKKKDKTAIFEVVKNSVCRLLGGICGCRVEEPTIAVLNYDNSINSLLSIDNEREFSYVIFTDDSGSIEFPGVNRKIYGSKGKIVIWMVRDKYTGIPVHYKIESGSAKIYFNHVRQMPI